MTALRPGRHNLCVTWVVWLAVAAVGWTLIAMILGVVLARMIRAATDF
jgi:hypothetical protein